MSTDEANGGATGNKAGAKVPAPPTPVELGDDERLAALMQGAHPPVRLRSAVRDDLGRELRLRVARYGESKQAGFWVYMWTLLRENETGAAKAVMAAGLSRLLHLSGRGTDAEAGSDHSQDDPEGQTKDQTDD